HAWVNDPFKVQERPMDFDVTHCEKLIGMVSNSPLQPTFKKPLLLEFWLSIKEYALSEKDIKTFLSFPTMYPSEGRFSLYTSTKAAYHNRLSIKLCMRIQM
ncbi:ZBED5 protein, partial [Crocuta crocuta]